MNSRSVIVIFVLFILISAGMVWHTKSLQENVVKTAGLQNAALYSDAISAFRAVYTDKVVALAGKHGLAASHDYAGRKAIPLPATLSILLGEALGANGSGVMARLYSPYPFPWRKQGSGLSDDFSRQAWAAFSGKPDKPFYRFYLQGKTKYLRFAVADRMRASCVGCHNTYKGSPRTGWKVGDVRGILEIRLPLDNVIAAAGQDLNTTIAIYTLMSVLGLVGMIFFISHHRRESAELRAANVELQTALGEIRTLQGIIPICSYCYSIRDDEGAWSRVEAYISEHSDARFSHGVCPKCMDKLYDGSGLERKPGEGE